MFDLVLFIIVLFLFGVEFCLTASLKRTQAILIERLVKRLLCNVVISKKNVETIYLNVGVIRVVRNSLCIDVIYTPEETGKSVKFVLSTADCVDSCVEYMARKIND